MDMTNGQCLQNCESGFSFNSTNKKCEKTSPADACLSTQTTISGKCYDACQSDYFMDMSNGQCIQNCPSGFSYNAAIKKCEKTSPADICSSNQKLINGFCYDPCETGYFMDSNGQCIKDCQTGFSYNLISKKCEKTSSPDSCSGAQILINNACYEPCNSGYTMDMTNGKCIENCKNGFRYNPLTKICEQYSEPDICLSTQTTISGKCYDFCPQNYFMDAYGQCIQSCQEGFSYNETTGRCESNEIQNVDCPPDSTLINDKCYKNCTNSIMDIEGNCITCPENYIYDSSKNLCVKEN
jgi:hypothetical protein